MDADAKPGEAPARMVDTHVHVDHLSDHGLEAVLGRARAAGVTRLVAVGGSPAMNAAALRAARRFPDQVKAALGSDRNQAGEPSAPGGDEAPLPREAAAVGEIGLDYHYAPGTAPAQRRLFTSMLNLALSNRKPVIVHTRAADRDTLAILREAHGAWRGAPGTFGVLHCFTGSAALAEALLELDMMISFSGIVTFPRSGALREVARQIPADRLLIETDTPYLAPAPHRGRENEPAYLVEVARAVAGARAMDLAAFAALTASNAERLFGPWRPPGGSA